MWDEFNSEPTSVSEEFKVALKKAQDILDEQKWGRNYGEWKLLISRIETLESALVEAEYALNEGDHYSRSAALHVARQALNASVGEG